MQTVHAGDPIKLRADDWNSIVHCVNQNKRGGLANGSRQRPQDTKPGTILVQNLTGADRRRGEVVGLDAPLFNHEDDPTWHLADRIVFKTVVPGVVPTNGKIAVLQEPIAAGEIGEAIVEGITVARLTWNTETANSEFADIVTNIPILTASRFEGSAHILYKNPESEYAVVRLTNPVDKPIAVYVDLPGKGGITASGRITTADGVTQGINQDIVRFDGNVWIKKHGLYLFVLDAGITKTSLPAINYRLRLTSYVHGTDTLTGQAYDDSSFAEILAPEVMLVPQLYQWQSSSWVLKFSGGGTPSPPAGGGAYTGEIKQGSSVYYDQRVIRSTHAALLSVGANTDVRPSIVLPASDSYSVASSGIRATVLRVAGYEYGETNSVA